MRFARLASVVALFLLLFPAWIVAAKDPADYTLKVHVMRQMWGSHNLRYSEYKATGSGNIIDGPSIHAFDFKYDCSVGIIRTPQNQPYLGKWNKPQLRLELLIQRIGKEGKYQTCELETTLREGVYIFRQGILAEISQDEFKAWKAQRQAAAQQQNPSSAGVKVSASSTPDGADIEVDGAFVGTTPSVLQLDPGEHTVTVTKPGYVRWEKKLKLVAGDIRLNAELQPEKPADTGSAK